MMELKSVIEDMHILHRGYIVRDGFIYTSIMREINVFDALIIRNPPCASCQSPRLGSSECSLEEHIQLVNAHGLEKALIIGEDISFVSRCPSLRYLQVIPADNAGDGFDFSPLYDMPEIKHLACKTVYGNRDQFSGSVDYARIKGLEDLNVSGKGNVHYERVETLKSLFVSGIKGGAGDLTDYFCSAAMRDITVMQCGLRSLKGIGRSRDLESVTLWYNRSLTDVAPLREVHRTLKVLAIENCPKITDFSCLQELANLKHLELLGSNALPDLSFLNAMKDLETFTFTMNVLDGDLGPCIRLPYACCGKNRKHYQLKDKDLPKGRFGKRVE